MKEIIKKLPLPISGLMLGLAALGNLLVSYGQVYRNICAFLSSIILILLLLKIGLFPQVFKKDLENVVVESVFPTFSMSIMLLSVLIKPVNDNLALIAWSTGIVIHILLMLNFTRKHVLSFNIKKVFPSWFIVYVGIAVGGITGPAFGKESIGQVLFYFALASLLVLLVVVFRRLYIVKEIPDPAIPCFGIITAPAALCLAAYMNSFTEKNIYMVYFLLILSQALYLLVLINLPRLLKLNFSPAFSSFTFPLVISGISLKLTNGYLIKAGRGIDFLNYLVKFEELLALVLVVYVLASYIRFIISSHKKLKPVESSN